MTQLALQVVGEQVLKEQSAMCQHEMMKKK